MTDNDRPLSPELDEREDATNKTALAEKGAPDPSVHREAAAPADADAEAGAANTETGGITPIKDTPPPETDA